MAVVLRPWWDHHMVADPFDRCRGESGNDDGGRGVSASCIWDGGVFTSGSAAATTFPEAGLASGLGVGSTSGLGLFSFFKRIFSGGHYDHL